MTILSNRDIRENLGGEVMIYPFVDENVNTASVDVRLGAHYYVERRPPLWRRFLSVFGMYEVYNIWDLEHVRRVWGEPLRAASRIEHRFYGWRRHRYRGIGSWDRVIMIPPKTTILAHTEEFIGGRWRVVGMMKARSSMGRNFIEVCKCAGWGDVGYFNRWTMEITNNSKWRSIPLVVGRRIAQIVLVRTGDQEEGQDDYAASGKYQDTGDIEELRARWRPESMLPRLDLDRDARVAERMEEASWIR